MENTFYETIRLFLENQFNSVITDEDFEFVVGKDFNALDNDEGFIVRRFDNTAFKIVGTNIILCGIINADVDNEPLREGQDLKTSELSVLFNVPLDNKEILVDTIEKWKDKVIGNGYLSNEETGFGNMLLKVSNPRPDGQVTFSNGVPFLTYLMTISIAISDTLVGDKQFTMSLNDENLLVSGYTHTRAYAGDSFTNFSGKEMYKVNKTSQWTGSYTVLLSNDGLSLELLDRLEDENLPRNTQYSLKYAYEIGQVIKEYNKSVIVTSVVLSANLGQWLVFAITLEVGRS